MGLSLCLEGGGSEIVKIKGREKEQERKRERKRERERKLCFFHNVPLVITKQFRSNVST